MHAGDHARNTTARSPEALGGFFMSVGCPLDSEDDWIEARLAEAPELTDEQITHLRRLLGSGDERMGRRVVEPRGVADREDAEDVG